MIVFKLFSRIVNTMRVRYRINGVFVFQVLYVGDSYVPVTTQLRSRPISPADSTVLDWRLQTVESWDGRRHGNNKTRVQREYTVSVQRFWRTSSQRWKGPGVLRDGDGAVNR